MQSPDVHLRRFESLPTTLGGAVLFLVLVAMPLACSDDTSKGGDTGTDDVPGELTGDQTGDGDAGDVPTDVPGDTAQDVSGDTSVDATDTSMDTVSDAMPDLGPPTDPLVNAAMLETVSTSHNFTEGPVWRPGGPLLYTDIPQDEILELSAMDMVTTFRTPSGNANGLANHSTGELLAAEHFNRRISITSTDGTVTGYATMWNGNRFNSPNDLVVRSDGTVFFTDPPYGLNDHGQAREIDFNGVFRIDPDGTVTDLWQGPMASRPNGIALSRPAEDVLYVADTAGDVVRAYDIAMNGTLGGERTFATVSAPDGMVVDARGNLFVTTNDGVEVFAPDGTQWGTVATPRRPSNCTLGGPNNTDLYITARSDLYRVRLAP